MTASLPTLQKVTWVDSVSDTGIQLGANSITREGLLLGVQLLPGANGLSLVGIIRRLSDNNITVLDASSFKFVD